MPERPDKSPLAVHRQIARSPHRRQADITGEDGVLRGVIADHLGDLMRVDQAFAGRADGQIVERLARFGVVLSGLRKMRAVAFLLQQRQQGGERCLYSPTTPRSTGARRPMFSALISTWAM